MTKMLEIDNCRSCCHLDTRFKNNCYYCYKFDAKALDFDELFKECKLPDYPTSSEEKIEIETGLGNINYGWICPKCKSALSPYVTACSCSNKRQRSGPKGYSKSKVII